MAQGYVLAKSQIAPTVREFKSGGNVAPCEQESMEASIAESDAQQGEEGERKQGAAGQGGHGTRSLQTGDLARCCCANCGLGSCGTGCEHFLRPACDCSCRNEFCPTQQLSETGVAAVGDADELVLIKQRTARVPAFAVDASRCQQREILDIGQRGDVSLILEAQIRAAIADNGDGPIALVEGTLVQFSVVFDGCCQNEQRDIETGVVDDADNAVPDNLVRLLGWVVEVGIHPAFRGDFIVLCSEDGSAAEYCGTGAAKTTVIDVYQEIYPRIFRGQAIAYCLERLLQSLLGGGIPAGEQRDHEHEQEHFHTDTTQPSEKQACVAEMLRYVNKAY